MPALKLSSIGDHNERILLQFLSAANTKEITVKSVFEHLNWDHQNSKGEKLTRKKVQNRLDYLRKLGRENRDKFLEICSQHGFQVDWTEDWTVEGVDGQHSSIGDQNDKVLLRHLLSADKDKSLKWIFDRINLDYQGPKGKLLTRKKVQGRLEYLRSLEKDKRGQFLKICLQNGLKIDCAAEGSGDQFSDADEEDYQEEKEEDKAPPVPTPERDLATLAVENPKPPAQPTRTTKRDLATMTAANLSKRAKTIHYELRVQLGVPQETPVYEFQPGQIVYGKKVLILPATNELPGNPPCFVINALRRWSSYNNKTDKTVVIMS